MIGDDYGVFVLGVYRVGWQTLWFNPACMACPGLTPLHNGEIYHLGMSPSELISNLRAVLYSGKVD